jgi:uncharacterized protein
MTMKISKALIFFVVLFFSNYACADYKAVLKKAKQGDPKAQYSLAIMYQFGKGVPEDDRKAFKWTQLAAMQGYPKAQNNLGYMYDVGEGVAQNNMRAYVWKYFAAAQGELDAAEHRDDLAKQMSKQQLKEAKKMIRECKARSYKYCY